MQIDIAKLAFDASKEHPEFPDDAETPTGDELAVFQRFAAFVLEAAAVQCEEADRVTFVFAGQTYDDAGGSLYAAASAIRAMKPGESNE